MVKPLMDYTWNNEEDGSFVSTLSFPVDTKFFQRAIDASLKGMKVFTRFNMRKAAIEKIPIYKDYLGKLGIDAQLRKLEKELGVFIIKYSVDDAYFQKKGLKYTAFIQISGMCGETTPS